MSKLTVGVVFGSRSVEHDVSVVTAIQVMKALNPAKYTVLPIYITRDGRWFTGETLTALQNFRLEDISELSGTRPTHLSPNPAYAGLIPPPVGGLFSKNSLRPVDVFFPAIHGSHGEDGTLQGLFEMANVAYVGAGVAASALANDKGLCKALLKAQGLPVLEKAFTLTRHAWKTDRQAALKRLADEVGYPAFIKPLTLGSSVGIGRVEAEESAALHLDIALNLDRAVLIEEAASGADVVEINCAVLGNHTLRASTLEQPVSYEQFLTYEEKYMREGGRGMKAQERIIPAPLSPELTQAIQETAIRAFQAIRGRGTARLDFLLDKATGRFWINEINTLPGSLAFYLWEAGGLTPSALCDELIQIALEVHAEKQATTYDYKTRLIELAASRGVKSLKGGKSPR